MSQFPPEQDGFVRQQPVNQGWQVPRQAPRPAQTAAGPQKTRVNPPRQPASGYIPVNPVQKASPPTKKPKKTGSPLQLVLVVVVALLLIGAAYFGINAMRDNKVRESIAAYQHVYGPNIFINDVPISGMNPQEALAALKSAMNDRINSWNLGITYRGHTFTTMNYSSLGYTVSEQDLYQQLNAAWNLTHSGDIHQQKKAIDALAVTPYKSSTSQNEMNDAQLTSILAQILPHINSNPVDAAILEFRPDEPSPFVFQDERYGYQLDTNKAKEEILALANSGQSGQYELKPETIAPKVTRAELQKTVALRTTISTAISSSSDDNRNHNIRLSLSRINGTILKPGQNFSFNKTVGPRTLKAGFAEAPEYAYRELVTGVGGGVCQSSTTLYQAAMTAGLSITKRQAHSDPVNYTDLGLDATVYLSSTRNIDFQFKNNTNNNIYLVAHLKSASSNSKKLVAEISIYGEQMEDGISYRMVASTVEVIPAPLDKEYTVDKTGLVVKYKDEEKLRTSAKEGHVVETYLEKLQNGILVDRKLISRDTYDPKAAVYWIGDTERVF